MDPGASRGWGEPPGGREATADLRGDAERLLKRAPPALKPADPLFPRQYWTDNPSDREARRTVDCVCLRGQPASPAGVGTAVGGTGCLQRCRSCCPFRDLVILLTSANRLRSLLPRAQARVAVSAGAAVARRLHRPSTFVRDPISPSCCPSLCAVRNLIIRPSVCPLIHPFDRCLLNTVPALP